MRTILILICMASAAWAQNETYGHTANSATKIDMAAAASTRPVKESASAPGTCVKGEQYFNTTSATNFTCTATDTWSAVGGSAKRTIAIAVGDPAGTALSTGVLGYLVVPAACTIVAWDIVVDAGTATVDVWKIATGTAKPTVSNTITASAKPAISTGTAIHSTTLTGWTTSISANDIFGFNLDAVATAKYIYVGVVCE